MNTTIFLSKQRLYLLFILCFSIIFNAYGQDKEWTSFTKSLKMTTDVKLKFKLTASIKLVDGNVLSWASIWAQVQTKNDEDGFFDNMQDRPVISSDWATYEINGFIDDNSTNLNFGGICFSSGKFYFDDFKLYVENKNTGEFEEVKLDNADFEKTITDEKLSDWEISDPVLSDTITKGYGLKLIKDDPAKNLSLYIEGKNIKTDRTDLIGERDGYSPQIGTLISMLNNLSSRVERVVKNLDKRELDHLHDDKANSIGALIMHLAAAEKIYQLYTFENRGFNEEEKEFWGPALNLGDAGRKAFKDHDVEYYLKIYKEVRAKTLEEFKKLDDSWLAKIRPGSTDNNHYYWFHVMEHQSSHLGQILFLKKRIPPEPNINLKEKKKID